MKSKFIISLKFKLTIIISILVAAISLFVYFYFPQKFKEERLKSLKEKAEAVAKIAAYGVATGNYFEEKKSVNKLIETDEEIETLLQNEAIRYVVIKKRDSLFYEYNIFTAILNNYSNLKADQISEKWKILKVNAPVIIDNEKVGDIYIGYSLQQVYEKIAELKHSITIVSIIIFIFGTILVYIVGLFFTYPLTQMVQTVKKISAGDLTQRAPVISNDEVGYLAQSFNKMVKKIQEANRELELVNTELEKRVKERTVELEKALRTLQKENKEKEIAQNKIKSSLKEKEVLLKEIHHRVKNNLQIVSSLFFFQSKTISDPQMLEMFRDGQNRVKSMALIHEKLYQSGDLANIDFKEYVKKLATFLFQSYGVDQSKIKFKNNVFNIQLGVDQAVPCGLIINELISNSLKHGFKNKDYGTVKIDMGHDENNNLIMKISDDGEGLPEGLDIQKIDSLGLRLVNNLSLQLNGKVEYFNQNGTMVKVTFQDAKYRMAS
jgi:two-component sensor histidine kinase